MLTEKTVIALCGPTAAGKTDLAIKLALQYHTQIISADSRQCFREINIGVAKPTDLQLQVVTHYFVNSHSIFDNVNVGTFEKYALDASKKIFAENDSLILAGGTGLYVKGFLEGLDAIPEVDELTESNIRKQYSSDGFHWLESEIKKKDPLFASKGEMQNPQRMMRALGVMMTTGKSILEFHSSSKDKRDFKVEKIFLNIPRQILYERINKRVDRMMEEGLLDEVMKLIPYKNLNALQTVGYRELFDYFEKKTKLSEAVELIKRNTRHYAKRQLTWFKKYFIDAETKILNNVD